MEGRRLTLTTYLNDACLLEVAKQLARHPEGATEAFVALASTCKKMQYLVDTKEAWERILGNEQTVKLMRTSHRLANTARRALTSLDLGGTSYTGPEVLCMPFPNLLALRVRISLQQAMCHSLPLKIPAHRSELSQFDLPTVAG